ncbi:MAG TPA: outer membrane beta-barrel protein, partial [Candidatus Paceibacterota bacterium]|nr:outer membrane beta-barrel protein [Candidatus Paceibacterota bacterium]
DKPLDATPFSAGYHIELWTGASNNQLGTGSLIRQAYLALGTTIGGQEIDWKIGVWDTIIGYEGLTSANNPNYTHSYGFFIEPTTHTGVQANYKVNDNVSLQAGVADDSFAGGAYSAAINGAPSASAGGSLHHPTLMGAITLTAPESFGPLNGATLTVGDIYTAAPATANTLTPPASNATTGGFGDSVYAGVTVPTPISALKFGGAFDYLDGDAAGLGAGHIWVAGIYGTYQATDKLSFDLRGETYGQTAPILDASKHGEEFTATAQYALWANVLSRVELRWDHADDANVFASNANGKSLERNAVFAGAQLIYTF